jgi:hypothetical protein
MTGSATRQSTVLLASEVHGTLSCASVSGGHFSNFGSSPSGWGRKVLSCEVGIDRGKAGAPAGTVGSVMGMAPNVEGVNRGLRGLIAPWLRC